MNAYQPDTLINGGLNILPQLPAASTGLILTDPPYITRYRSKDGRTIANDANDALALPCLRRAAPGACPQQLLHQLLWLASRRPLPDGLP